eukprot:gene5710-10961_t
MPYEADGTADFGVKSSEVEEPCFNRIIKQNKKWGRVVKCAVNGKCNRKIPFAVEMPYEADGAADFGVKSSEIEEPCFNRIIKQNKKARQGSEKCSKWKM